MLHKFETYQLATQLYQSCLKIQAPRYVRDQLLRASLSVVLNLAEGSAKPSAKDRRRFYSISLASTREVQAILQLLSANEAFALADRVGACCYRLTYSQ